MKKFVDIYIVYSSVVIFIFKPFQFPNFINKFKYIKVNFFYNYYLNGILEVISTVFSKTIWQKVQ